MSGADAGTCAGAHTATAALPIPPPYPVPLDGGPNTFDNGSPSCPVVGSLISGGTTTEGVATSLGLSLRMTIAGGTIWSLESLGNAPLGAASLSRSPPPPPPPALVFDAHRQIRADFVTSPTTCCLISSCASRSRSPTRSTADENHVADEGIDEGSLRCGYRPSPSPNSAGMT